MITPWPSLVNIMEHVLKEKSWLKFWEVRTWFELYKMCLLTNNSQFPIYL